MKRLRTNAKQLVMNTVAGDVAHPKDRTNPYRIGQDGVPRILPGTGGIVFNHRVGDPCIGLVGDHVEPGVSIRNYKIAPGKVKDAFNLALNTYACVGNRAVVLEGPCAGATGMVTGKHGGVDHVLLEFPDAVLRRLRLGDPVQVYAFGTGLKLLDYPRVFLANCAPVLLRHWGITAGAQQLRVPVTHRLPARLMGSGLGKSNVQRGDYDIQLFDRKVMKQFGLDGLRFGDFIAIDNADARFGRSFHRDHISIGVIVHADSTVAGHGPGVVALLSGPRSVVVPVKTAQANLATVMNLRRARRPRSREPFVVTEARERRRAHQQEQINASLG